MDDYPEYSMWDHQEGLVEFRLTVGPDGRIIGCTIVSSSGHQLLDDRTCEVVQRRARYVPAADASGKPVSSEVQLRFKWQIGDTGVPLENWARVTRITLARGQVTGCTTQEYATPKPVQDEEDACTSARSMTPRLIDTITGDADSVTLTAIDVHEVAGKPPRRGFSMPTHGQKLFEHRIAFDVLPDGKSGNCRVERDEGADLLDRFMFHCHSGYRYPADANPMRRASFTRTLLLDGPLSLSPQPTDSSTTKPAV